MARPRKHWPDGVLIRAAAEERSARSVIRRIGGRINADTYRRLRREVSRLCIDTSHWLHGGPGRPGVQLPPVADETLRAAVEAADGCTDCLRRIGWPATGSARRRLREAIDAASISTAHWKGGAH